MSDEIHTSAEVHEASALPCARVVHATPNPPQTAELEPLPEGMAAELVGQKSPAQWAYERLILYIQNFEKQLDNEHEVAMGFAGGDTGVLRIEGIGYFDPDIVTFYGRDETEARTQLIQHVSQLSVMLRALPRAQEEGSPRRIGFLLAADLDRKPAKTAAQGSARS
ncbi:MAG: hypothetical protein H6895_03870 [Defluviimonas sp.]|uniref:DUF6173 family protein n=1 Tax=Albidovulum sp. TaxID=1872424 RepID=UPI001D4AD760|nr:hypothetical protein [Paracoccaceae bacterium]MCC0063209.1 hypothetical protein [Defluviimonas sp.]